MKNVIVTVKIDNSKKEAFDIIVNSDTPADKLLKMLCLAYNLGSEKDYNIFSIPPNRLLEPDETFEEAGIWDGSILFLQKNK